MTNCKNCPYTDEYCASGDCERDNNLTEQFDNDEITKGNYYCKSKLDGHECIAGFVSNKGLFDCNYNGTLNKGYWEVLAPVPSYEEYEQLENWNRFTADYHALREAKEIAEYEKVELLEKVKQLKDLLKECRRDLIIAEEDCGWDRSELIQQIDEVLK